MINDKNAETSVDSATPAGEPVVISAKKAGLLTSKVSKSALQVVDQLQESGHAAELVGGCVRDLLLRLSPKDFDVTTDARPEAVRQIFRRARLIGRRFRLAHVRIGRETIEVATYRTVPVATDDNNGDGEFDDTASLDGDDASQDLDAEFNDDDAMSEASDTVAIVDDNVYGTRAEDAMRRDFTVNALYYDPREDVVIDYVNGLEDIKKRVLRMIGDPQIRFREDPVRMLRAARFSAKLDFDIEPDCRKHILELAYLIEDVPAARLFDELFKLFHHGKASVTFDRLLELGLFEPLMPKTQAFIDEPDSLTEKLLRRALANTDDRVAQGKPVIAAFFFSVALWDAFRLRLAELESFGVEHRTALFDAADDVIEAQTRRVTIPRRVSIPVREIWHFQFRLEKERSTRPWRLVEHKRFRAAYDFYLLRAQCQDADPKVGDWWTKYQDLDKAGRDQMVNELRGDGGRDGGKKKKSGKKKRRRRRQKRTPDSSNSSNSNSGNANGNGDINGNVIGDVDGNVKGNFNNN